VGFFDGEGGGVEVYWALGGGGGIAGIFKFYPRSKNNKKGKKDIP